MADIFCHDAVVYHSCRRGEPSTSRLGTGKLGNLNDPRYAALTRRAAAAVDRDERAHLLRRAEAYAMSIQALIPVYHHAARNLVGPHVDGWQDNLLDVHRSRYLRVD